MLMEEVFERLREYQEILTKRVGIEREVDEIPKALDAQMELLSRVKKSYLEKNEAFQAAEAKVRELRPVFVRPICARYNFLSEFRQGTIYLKCSLGPPSWHNSWSGLE